MTIVEQIAEILGSKAEIGRVCGVTRYAVQQWKRVPAHHVLKLEKATGINRKAIRPDIFA